MAVGVARPWKAAPPTLALGAWHCSLPLRRLQEREQVGQFLAGELFVEAGRHHTYRTGAHLGDFSPGDARLDAGTGAEPDFVGRVAAQDAALLVTGPGGDDDRLGAAAEAGAGVDERFEQIARGANLA